MSWQGARPPLLLALILLGPCPAWAQRAPPLDTSPVARKDAPSTLPDGWWETGPIMQIYVRSYRDSDGDGKGDLRGITTKLPYLEALGVKGIWLTPIFRSQDHDHGYAVTDYRSVDPDLGTLADLDALLAAAHARGIGVVLDYPANHSARTHPAFVRSEDRGSEYRGWYLWRDKAPRGWRTWNPDKPDPWTPDGAAGAFYAVFWEQMPDFDFTTQAVKEFHRSNLRTWLNRGVDGIRFDAVSEFVNLEGGRQDDVRSAELSGMLAATVREYPNRWVICEAASAEIQGKWAPARHAEASACGAAFGFPVNFIFNEIVASTKGAGKAQESLNWYFRTFPAGRMGTLLGNHDSFTASLDGVYRGRELDILDRDPAAYRLAAALNLLAPGIPFIYYGEEIGMSRQSGEPGHHEQLRAPMSWDAADGFTTGKPYRPYADNRATFNVADEEQDPGSLLGWYRRLIQLRASQPVLLRGDPEPVEGGRAHGDPFVYTRVLGEDRVWLVFNPGTTVGKVTSSHGGRIVPIFNADAVTVDASRPGRITFSGIPPRGVAVFRSASE